MNHITRLKYSIIIILLLYSLTGCTQNQTINSKDELLTGADQIELYLPLLKGKKVALAANHSSLIGRTHLVDTLLSLNVDVVRVFAPEHGFRGMADAGEHIDNGKDIKSGLPIFSLYGNKRKPQKSALQDIDIILFDIQDVGVRFYTYISTLSYIMEAAAEMDLPVIVLDRPNPNGFYIAGPVMEDKHRSFVGLHPVPIVYGMTIGEYAKMVNGEYWLADSLLCQLSVIPLKNYDRSKLYKLAVKPSPNLPSWQSVYLYPSLCLFEGTLVSVGRGTDFPFSIYGHPDLMTGSYVFIPEPRPGAMHPKLQGDTCFGQNLNGYAESYLRQDPHFNLGWLINAYSELNMGDSFFIPYFEKLSGTDNLRQQIISYTSEDKIRQSWQPGLDGFKKIRKKYLLYNDL